MTMFITRRGMMKSVGVSTLAAFSGAGISRAVASGTPPEPGPTSKIPVVAGAMKSLSKSGEYLLTPLPYAYGALAPEIEETILRIHHTKHHQGYVNGLNGTLKRLVQARASGDFSQVKPLCRSLAFHGSGHVLHTLYWNSMKPGGSGAPTGNLKAALQHDFGSLEAFKAQFLATTKKVEGSGWGLLAYEPLGGKLLVLQVEKHQNLTIWGVVPLLVCDVWEHAYYLQYQNHRGDYVDNFFKLIDWEAVAGRLAQVVK